MRVIHGLRVFVHGAEIEAQALRRAQAYENMASARDAEAVVEAAASVRHDHTPTALFTLMKPSAAVDAMQDRRGAAMFRFLASHVDRRATYVLDLKECGILEWERE